MPRAYLCLLAAVGCARLFEMRLSRRHQHQLARLGLRVEPEPGFALMVALHTAILVGSAIEVVVGHRPLLPAVAIPAALCFVAANGLRLWVIRTMASHWNVRVVNTVSLGVVTTGPFRFVRHPNYVAVFVELLALPLIHGAYGTALIGGLVHAIVLVNRVGLEERTLFSSPAYREAMVGKPRFIPHIFAKSASLDLHREHPRDRGDA
jgi:methyltransferase